MNGGISSATATIPNASPPTRWLAINPDSIPWAVTERARWVVWRAEMRGGKVTKVPYRGDAPAEKASSTDPRSWTDFATAMKTHAHGKADGVGFVLAADVLVGVDIDGCRDSETGELTPEATAIVHMLSSYTWLAQRPDAREVAPGLVAPLERAPKERASSRRGVSVMSTDRQAADLVHADDIRWTSDPVPRLELLSVADLLDLGPGDLLEYAYELQRDLLATSGVLYESFTALARLTKQRDGALEQLRRRRAHDTRPPS